VRFHISNCFPTNVNNSKIVPKHLSGNLVSESNIRKMAAGDYNGITKECDEGSPDKPGGLSIQLCKSEKKEFYIRYSS